MPQSMAFLLEPSCCRMRSQAPLFRLATRLPRTQTNFSGDTRAPIQYNFSRFSCQILAGRSHRSSWREKDYG
jgi:hypothetical protein